MALSESTMRRLWAYVEKTPDCWVWIGARGKGFDTYGRFNIGGRIVRAHRLIYTLLVGPIPDGLELRHTCDNPPCVNPAHLVPSTHAENMADMKAKARSNGPLRDIATCVRGLHALVGDNLIIKKDGGRLCRACRKETEQKWNDRTAAIRASKPRSLERTCATCGTSFKQSTHAGRPARFCSRICRNRWWNGQEKEKAS